MNTAPPEPHGTPRWRQMQRDRLAHVHARISQLESEFQADGLVMELLDKERRELRAEVRKLKGIVDSFQYDITTVPPEIISRIFVLCLPADGRVEPSPHAAPLLLTQITGVWRHIALKTSELWTSFSIIHHRRASLPRSHLRPRHRFDHPYDGAYALATTWFQRTNAHPLSLTLHCSPNRREIPSQFVQLISQYAPQWERIEITFPQRDLDRALSKFEAAGIAAPFPRLSTLVLNVAEWFLNVQSVQHAPRLPNLRIFSTPRPFNAPPIAPSLTTLEIEAQLLIEECTTIFRLFPSLVHFRILSIDPHPLPAPAISNVPPLESLNLDDEGFGLLARVTLPHLRRLHFTLELDEDVHTLVEFLARSACPLNDLTLRVGLVADDFALLPCLKAVPMLETLRIEYTHTEDVPRTLYIHLESTTLLPHLRVLSVSELTRNSTSPGVVDMLRARRLPPEAHPRFSSFDLAFARVPAIPSIFTESAEEIDRLIKGGLRLRVHGRKWEWPAVRQNCASFPLCSSVDRLSVFVKNSEKLLEHLLRGDSGCQIVPLPPCALAP